MGFMLALDNCSRMPWRLRFSVETMLRLTLAVLGWSAFSIAGLCAAHPCLDHQASSLSTATAAALTA